VKIILLCKQILLLFWKWSPSGAFISIFYILFAFLITSLQFNCCQGIGCFCGLFFFIITFPAFRLINMVVPGLDINFHHQFPTASDLVSIGLYISFCVSIIYITVGSTEIVFNLLRKRQCPHCREFQTKRKNKTNPIGFFGLAAAMFIVAFIGGKLGNIDRAFMLLTAVFLVIIGSFLYAQSEYACQVCGYHWKGRG
jgi:hypothetical protein